MRFTISTSVFYNTVRQMHCNLTCAAKIPHGGRSQIGTFVAPLFRVSHIFEGKKSIFPFARVYYFSDLQLGIYIKLSDHVLKMKFSCMFSLLSGLLKRMWS